MTRTFLVAVSYDDGVPPDPFADAEEISDALEKAGIPVESCHPWAQPALAAQPSALQSVIANPNPNNIQL